VVGVEALKFGIEVRGKDAFLRGQLQCIGQSIVPLAEELLSVAAAAVRTVGSLGLKTVFQVIAERAQQCFIGLGMQPPDAVVLVLFFDQAQTAFAGLGIEDQDADVHPLVANEIRGVTEDAVGARSFSRRGSGTQRFDGLFIHGSHPVRKRLAIRSLGLQNQVRHAVAAVQLFGQFRGQPDQLLGDGDNLHRDRGQPEARRQPGSKQFVDQDAAMLRIILEFHDVVVAVVAAHQMRLRATPHPAYLFQCRQHARLC